MMSDNLESIVWESIVWFSKKIRQLEEENQSLRAEKAAHKLALHCPYCGASQGIEPHRENCGPGNAKRKGGGR